MIKAPAAPDRAVILRGTVARDSLSPSASTLSVPFVGGNLAALPSASAFGILARLIRLNAMAPIDLFRLLGIRTRRADDLSELMTFSEARQLSLARALGLPSVPPAWNLSAWFPFQSPSELLSSNWSFRYCPQCLRAGYHTHLHQLPWIQRCAWHGSTLRDVCPCCGEKPPVRAEWEFDRNMTCRCGHTLMSTDAALRLSAAPPTGAAVLIDKYLQWAAGERAKSVLITPEHATDAASALSELVEIPKWLSDRCGEFESRSHMRAWRMRACRTADREAVKHFDTLRQDRPGFMSVPAETRMSIARVAADLALKLPASTLTDREMSLFLAGAGIEAPRDFEPARRGFSGSLSLLPPWEVAGQQFLNLACLHPMSYRPVARLIDAALNGRSVFDFSAQAEPPEVSLLVKACGHLLTRGYAEGLRATLSRHIPELYAMGRDSPHLSKPWIMAVRDQKRFVSIRTVWTAVQSSKPAADLLEEADLANQRRGRRRR